MWRTQYASEYLSISFFLLTNITQTLSLSLQFPRRLRLAWRLRARATYIWEVHTYGLIENDSSAKRMRIQQPGENASCASAGRNSESDQTVGFSNSLSLFFFIVTSESCRRYSRRLLARKIMKRCGVTWIFRHSCHPRIERRFDIRYRKLLILIIYNYIIEENSGVIRAKLWIQCFDEN